MDGPVRHTKQQGINDGCGSPFAHRFALSPSSVGVGTRRVQASKRLQAKNIFLNDLKMAANQAAKAKCFDNDKTIASLDIQIKAYKAYHGTSNKTLIK